jgi:hypothetical protein
MQRHVLDDSVTLVEDGKNRDALAHRGDAGRVGSERHGLVADDRLRAGLFALLARGERERRQTDRCSREPHGYSGIQGS